MTYCRQCQKQITNSFPSTKRKYCSRECYYESRRKRVKVKCTQCGKEFVRLPHKVKKNNFCSKSCSVSFTKKGTKHSEKHKKMLSVLAKERGFGKWMLGKKHSVKTRLKLSRMQRGERSHLWKGGVHPENCRIRQSIEMKLWREKVFERDDYRCQWCGERGGKLHADHIFPFYKFKSKRFSLKNGRTLCVDCHEKRTQAQMEVCWENQYARAA